MGNFDRDRGDRNSRSGGARTWERRSPAEMYQAICDNCGKKCEVPFRPSSGKPIYCNDCFGGKRESRSHDSRPSQPQYNEQFEALDKKLDQILAILSPKVIEEAPVEVVEIEKKVKKSKKEVSAT